MMLPTIKDATDRLRFLNLRLPIAATLGGKMLFVYKFDWL